ncbi:MAG: hypothetical protein D6689_04770 [Deltaproteobacteria bacterium]|nr:MAG: hypothetical protein D6689_04770 [Deltaproteobacteria bacterium]
MTWLERARRLPLRTVAALATIGLIAAAVSTIHFGESLDYLDVTVLSGPRGGNYAAVVDRVARRAASRGGTVRPVTSAGSVDNLRRLAAAADDCSVDFALAQAGVPIPDDAGIELIGRLPRTEAVLLIGRDAGSLERFDQLRGLRVGVGPAGSGTDHLARRLFAAGPLARLDLQLENHALRDQVDRLVAGDLDLGVFVLDEDAALARDALVSRGLQLAPLAHLDAVARRLPFVTTGRLPAGLYDPIAVVPPADVPVMRVDTLLVGNGCASRSAQMALLSVLRDEIPGFVRRNREAPGGGPLPLSPAAREFYEHDGPGFADRYVPWLVDIMPLGNWVYVAMAVSVLFNAMAGVHRFRLWRVDAAREKATHPAREAIGRSLTPAEIATMPPTGAHRSAAVREAVDASIEALDRLRDRARRHRESMLVPMGQEWIYRYEEEQMELWLAALRAFRSRLDA